jgi:hypothetical protein
MPTGLGIRDFTKVYRELRYANEGALRLSEIEHNAYLNRLTIEVTHYDANRAINYKTNPGNTHWGYVTSFKGSSVIDSKAIKFVRHRVYEKINQGVWNYHQNKESVDVVATAVQTFGNLALGELSSVSDGIGLVGILINAVEGVELLTAPAFAWLYEVVTGEESPEDIPTKAYTPYPIVSPYPDVFKFKGDIPCSFLFRLESWYLVNPAVYITANPTDTSDETEGEDEYPEPQAGDGDGGSQEFPESSPNDQENDARDGGQKPAQPLEPATGYAWNGVFSGVLLGGGGQPENYTTGVTFSALGNQFPFTARATSQALISKDGETFYSGLEVLDRFGQVIGVFYQGTGFRAGAHTISVTATVNM